MNETPDSNTRSINLSRKATGHYVARNAAGAELEFGQGEGLLSPVELLLAAIAGCSAIDVDVATSRSAEPTRFEVTAAGEKVIDEAGANRMENLNLAFKLAFADDAGGTKAASMVDRLVKLSHDKHCTVSRTVEHGTAVGFDVEVSTGESA